MSIQSDLRQTWDTLLASLRQAGRAPIAVWPENAPMLPPRETLLFNAQKMLEELGVRNIQQRDLHTARNLMLRLRLRRDNAVGWLRLSVGDRGVLLEPEWGAVRRIALQPYEDRPMAWALLLALAWHSEVGRGVLSGAPWRGQLIARLPQAAGVASAKPSRHQGHVRYHLHLDKLHSVKITDFVQREILRLSKRGDKHLAPVNFTTLQNAREKIKGVLPVDERIDQHLHRLHHLRKALRSMSYEATTELRRIHDETWDALMHELAQVQDILCDEEPIEISATPLLPALQASQREDGALTLEWSPRLDLFVQEGRGYVLDWHGTLHPLDHGFPRSMWPLLTEELPLIPATHTVDFVRDFAVASPAPVLLPEEGSLGQSLDAPERIEPRLLLSEQEGVLRVEARFAYHSQDACPEIRADVVSPVVTGHNSHDQPVMLRRQRDREKAAAQSLAPWLGGSTTALLEGEQAYRFLLDGVPALEGDWTIFGASELRQHQVSGTLEPQVTFRSGMDWFDLDVSFEADGQRVRASELLESWLAGQKFYKLPHGSVARLPSRWLGQHGAALAEAEALRNSQGQEGLAPWTAPLLADLLEDLRLEDEEARRWADLGSRLASFSGVPEFTPAVPVHATLRAYQQDGARWLAFLRDMELGGVLADDMGLGKTLQTLVVLADTHSQPGPASLVVCPVSVVHNWAREAQRFVPSLKVHIHHGAQRGDIPEDADLVISTFALLRLDEERLQKRPWRYVVLDEAQHIKNPDSQTAQAARALEARHRLALTGTPMENHLLELWSIFQFVLPGFFGPRASFVQRYARPIQEEHDQEALAQLRRRLRPFVMRRRKDEVCAELPPRQEQVLHCDLSPAERKLYEGLRQTYRSSVMERVQEVGDIGRAHLAILEALTRLRQSCCHPNLVPLEEARVIKRSSKLDLLMETLEQLIEEDHRALIFSQWPSLLKLAQQRIKARGWNWLYLDGQTKQRQDLVERWNHPHGPPIFLISLKAGGTGLNLTGADCVIHLDPWWNPAVEAQATDRAHRIGQTRPVQVYRMVARDTVEEKILELQERKQELLDAALDTDGALVHTLTRQDLDALFSAQPS